MKVEKKQHSQMEEKAIALCNREERRGEEEHTKLLDNEKIRRNFFLLLPGNRISKSFKEVVKSLEENEMSIPTQSDTEDHTPEAIVRGSYTRNYRAGKE